MTALRRVVLPFDDGKTASMSPSHRGGKGMGLSLMQSLHLPVPSGFTISSGVHRAYMQHGRLPRRAISQLHREISQLEKTTSRRFGSDTSPLLVSVRSGAKVSMPGMMDTILNVGLTPEVLEAIEQQYGERFAGELLDNLTQQWPNGTVLGDDPYDQLLSAVQLVFASWDSERAVAYRKQHNISDQIGTAVTIQTMVYGNLDEQSCTGVVFSVNPSTGEPGLFGEFLPMAQGEDVVGGTRTPLSMTEFTIWNSQLDAQLRTYVDLLSNQLGVPVDVEFTVESGQLFLLQVRPAKLPSMIDAVSRVHRVWRGELSQAEAVQNPPSLTVHPAAFTQEDCERALSADRCCAQATPVSPGAAVGIVASSVEKARQFANAGHPVIFVRRDTVPSDLPGMQIAKAIVTERGGATCHAAIVARDLGIPAVTGVALTCLPAEGEMLSVDGTSGAVYTGELSIEPSKTPKEVSIFTRWAKRHAKGWIDFEANSQYSANVFLVDCYLLSMLLRHQPSEEVKELHDKTYHKVAGVFALYLLRAIAGEVRHTFHHWQCSSDAVRMVEDVLGVRIGNCLSRSEAQARAFKVARTLPSEQLQACVQAVATIFRKGYWSGGYGGAAWARIAETLLAYLGGEISDVVFVDAVFDLRHNGGRLFDKHPMLDLKTDDYQLFYQLNIKKIYNNPSALYRHLTESTPPSQEIDFLWRKTFK